MAEQRRLVDAPMPANVRLYVVVSRSSESTLIQFQGARRGVGKPVWGIGKNVGDGTVAQISALGYAPKDRVIMSNGDHQYIFEDEAIWGPLKTILLQ